MGDCEVCGEEIELDIDQLGFNVKCPQCGATYMIELVEHEDDFYALWLGRQVSQPTRKPWSEA